MVILDSLIVLILLSLYEIKTYHFSISTTNAFPIQKYRIFSGIPVFVQLSGKPLSLSHSIGVSTLSLSASR